jgi:hypothetical protein
VDEAGLTGGRWAAWWVIVIITILLLSITLLSTVLD